MPDMSINFYPGTACQNLGLSSVECSDGWHLFSIPIIPQTNDGYDPYSLENTIGTCDSENVHMNGVQISSEGQSGLCFTDIGWLGSIQTFNPFMGHSTRNQFGEEWEIELNSELPDINSLPLDENNNHVWTNLHEGMNFVSFPGTYPLSDGYNCMTPGSPNWYYRIQNTLDQYHYDNNPIRNKHDKLILSSGTPQTDPDDFSWIFSYQDKIADECPNSIVCCHRLCENDNGEYNCDSDISLGWGNLGTLMCNYTNTCCDAQQNQSCSYIEDENYSYNYGADTSCQILHPKQQGVCVYPDWNSSPERTENYCKSLPENDCYDIDVCVENDYCSVIPWSTSIFGECRISELLPLGNIQNVSDVPGSEYPFEWNPSSNPACGEGYLGHLDGCENGECVNAYHHCYACGGEWIPTGPVIDPNESCDMIANSIQDNISFFPQIEVLTYTNTLPEGTNYPIWAIHGSRCFAKTYGAWISSVNDGAYFNFFPDIETYYINSQSSNHDDHMDSDREVASYYEPNSSYPNRRIEVAGECEVDGDCPINFRCDENINMCVPIHSLSMRKFYSKPYTNSKLFEFDGLNWAIYMYTGNPGVDATYIPADNRGPNNEIEPGGPNWDVPKHLISDVIRSGVSRYNYIPPMPLDFKGGYEKYIKHYHKKLADYSKIPMRKRRKKSKKLKRKR